MEYVSAGPLGPFAATAWLAAVGGILYLLGEASFRAMRMDRGGWSRGEEAVFSTAAGFVLFSVALLVLGFSGLFERRFFILALGLASLSAVLAHPRPLLRPSPDLRGIPAALAVAALFAVSASWIQAVAPPVGNDDLAYHLAYPRIYLGAGRLAYLPHTYESLWPAQSELFYALGLSLQGAALAKLFHWIFYPLTAAATFFLTRRFWGARAGATAGTLFLFIPAAFAQSGHAYVDLSYAFFVLAAFYLYLLKKSMPETGAALLSGIFAGGAAATKILGLGPAAILALFWLAGSRRRFRSLGVFSLSAFAVAGVWYLRSWSLTGNPVYPFLAGIFGGNGIVFHLEHVGSGPEILGGGRGLAGFLLLGWNLTFHPGPYGGEMIGPAFLAFVPFTLFFARGARRESVELAFFAFANTAFIYSQSQMTRFFLSVAPFLCVGAAVAIDRLSSRKGILRAAAVSVLSGILLLHAGIFAYRIRYALPFIAGRAGEAEDYLSAHERSFKGYLWLRDHARSGERVFNAAEGRRFYSPPGVLARMTWNEDLLWRELEKKGKSLGDYLEDQKFDLVWVNNVPDPRIADYLSRAGYRPVYDYTFTEGNFEYRYQFFRRPELNLTPGDKH